MDTTQHKLESSAVNEDSNLTSLSGILVLYTSLSGILVLYTSLSGILVLYTVYIVNTRA